MRSSPQFIFAAIAVLCLGLALHNRQSQTHFYPPTSEASLPRSKVDNRMASLLLLETVEIREADTTNVGWLREIDLHQREVKLEPMFASLLKLQGVKTPQDIRLENVEQVLFSGGVISANNQHFQIPRDSHQEIDSPEIKSAMIRNIPLADIELNLRRKQAEVNLHAAGVKEQITAQNLADENYYLVVESIVLSVDGQANLKLLQVYCPPGKDLQVF